MLRGHEAELCTPFLAGDEKRCAWPGVLSLDLDEKGGSFRQAWTLEADAFVPLPGEAKRWPLDLQVDGQPGAAVSRQEAPGLWLPAGTHSVTGSFRWDVLPESLPVPVEVGVVDLTVRGSAVVSGTIAERDAAGRLFLRSARVARTEEDRLEVRVQRRVIDEVPLLLVTQVELVVSGKAREILLGRLLPERFLPLSITGAIPARLEPDGRLRVQVRPGNWALEATAWHAGPAAALTAPSGGGPWAAEEVWVFDARPALRQVEVQGVSAVDPQQTTLPDAWKALPAYRVRPGETMRLAESRRGAADPPADRLNLRRTLWLDFDGGGYTWQDQVDGVLNRSWRLEMTEPGRLQRVAVGGQDQVITQRQGSPLAGVEVRQGQLSLVAEGRLPGQAALPAVGWDHGFQQVSGELRLSPGWRLLGAMGVDEVPGSWLSRWTLFDLFLVLLLALAVRQLWGTRWGLLALAALALAWHEEGAPHWAWVAVLALEALRRGIPDGSRARRIAVGLTVVALAVLSLQSVAFLAGQVRTAIYPGLQRPADAGFYQRGRPLALQAEELDKLKSLGYTGGTANEAAAPSAAEMANAPARQPAAPPAETLNKMARLQEIDPRAAVGTGPGLPEWEWSQVELRWSGPVDADQRVRFFLVSPAANFVLTLIRGGLFLFLILRAFEAAGLGLARWRPKPAASASLLLLLALLPARAGAQGEAVPPAAALDELRQALLAPPDCLPDCASSPRLFVDVSPGALRLRFEVGAAAEVAVPLPGGAQQWLPREVSIDGDPAPVVRTPDGRIWTRVRAGRHEILLAGPLPDRESVAVPLPLRPHRVDVSATGWTVDGVHEDGQPDDTLQLTRVAARSGPAGGSPGDLQPGELPPFLRVERTLRLGLVWRVETRVSRLSPPGVPAVVAVPLLPGEAVTTAGVRVEKGMVPVSLGPQASEIAWSSTMAPRPEVRLSAPRTLAWTEVWRLDAGPVWHVEAKGIPPIVAPEGEEIRVPEWRPWPGEAVALAVSRPKGVEVQTLTMDRTTLTVSPGERDDGFDAGNPHPEQPRRPARGGSAGRRGVGKDRGGRTGPVDPAGGAEGAAGAAAGGAEDRPLLAGAARGFAPLPRPRGGPEHGQCELERADRRTGEPLDPPRRRPAPGAGRALLGAAGGDPGDRLGAGPGTAHAAHHPGLDPARHRSLAGAADRRRRRGRLASGPGPAPPGRAADRARADLRSTPDRAGLLDPGGAGDPLLGRAAGPARNARHADRRQRLGRLRAALVRGPGGGDPAAAVDALRAAAGLPAGDARLGAVARAGAAALAEVGLGELHGRRRLAAAEPSPPAPLPGRGGDCRV